MNEAIDGTVITAEVAKELTRAFLQKVEGPISKFVNKNILVHLRGFEPYLAKTYRRCNAVRILADREKVYEIKDIYVSPTYKCGSNLFSDNDIATKIRDGDRVIVQGFGGVGKTILLKHILISLFQSPEGKIPVFVELRKFNEIKDVDISSYISTIISTVDSPLSVGDFHTLMSAGRFTLIFDGFDEVNDERRDVIEGQILSLVADYPEVGFLISSRRDERFVSWQQFSIFSAQKYSQDEIMQIVDKVNFEKVVKSKFQKEIITKNFGKYEDFLSSPLLALMMLLTYRQFADIPEKIHIFYRYAFQTLFSLHDASKEAFKRKRKTNLDEDEFSRLFSVFCLMSYIAFDINFTKQKAIEYIDKAKKRTSIKVDSQKFLDECVESVNLLFKDGDLYTFVHRSFQEYFTAYSVVNVFSGDAGKLIKKLNLRPTDTVIQMAYEMNSDLIESLYFVEEYNLYKSEIDIVLSKDLTPFELLDHMPINWVILFAGKNTGPKGRILSMMAPSASFWDFLRKTQSCFLSDAMKDGVDVEIINPVGNVRSSIISLRKNLSVLTNSSASIIAITLDKNGIKTALIDGNIVDNNVVSEILNIDQGDMRQYIEKHLVNWRAHAVFMTKKMKEILRRERTRKITLDDII